MDITKCDYKELSHVYEVFMRSKKANKLWNKLLLANLRHKMKKALKIEDKLIKVELKHNSGLKNARTYKTK